ncbi:MAG: M20 family peptidase [Gemmatimonadota bacterium]
MKKLVLAALAALLVLAGIVVLRAATLSSDQVEVEPATDLLELDEGAAASRLAGALRFETVSVVPPAPVDTAAFLGLHDYLETTYPRVHAALRRERVNRLSLLYTWEGSEPGLEPAVLMGHLDVVPVIPGTEEDWTHGAFEGVVAEGRIWGRGAMDDKVTVLGILEAVEALLAQGYRPRRTIHLAFGHDEEVGGPMGARAMADTLARRSPELAVVLDEGGAVIRNTVPGLPGPVALVGIAEKGFLSARLRVEGQGGHSSVPPASTTVGILSEAIRRLEENPFPLRLDGPARSMRLTRPLVKRMVGASAEGAAMLRTTTAATMFEAGVKDNVLPITAEAVVNFRIRPGETVESTLDRVREVIDDSRVVVTRLYEGGAQDPSPVSDPDSQAYRLLARSIRESLGLGDVPVIPYLLVGGTDAKYYAGRSSNVLRFLPVDFGDAGLEAIHGTDERIPVEGFAGAVRFFHRFIRGLDTL